MNDKLLTETNDLLRIVAGLLLDATGDSQLSTRDKVAKLAKLGVKPNEIAKIIGKTGNHVNKELTALRKQKVI